MHSAIAGGALTVSGCVARLIGEPGSGFDTDIGTDTIDATSATTNTTTNTTTGVTTTAGTSTTTVGPTTDPTGDPPPMEGPPQLIDVRVVEPAVLELYFSEPVVAPSGADPQKFRLSVGWSNAYGYGTSYASPSLYSGEERCYEYCWCDYDDRGQCTYEFCEEYCFPQPGAPIEATRLIPGTTSASLQLGLSAPLTPAVCRMVERWEEWGTAGLFLHYTNNGSPAVIDLDAEVLDAIAEHWVLPPRRDWAYLEGYFPQMIPFIPIPCPG